MVSDDGFIVTKLLPPNVTSLIQPMDQGVLESMKQRYRISLLQDLLLSQDKDIVTFLKEINMLKVTENIVMGWDQISPQTIRHSWWKLNRDLASTFQTLGYEVGVVQAWLDSDHLGYEHLSDDQIVEQVEQLLSALNDVDELEDDTTDSPISSCQQQ